MSSDHQDDARDAENPRPRSSSRPEEGVEENRGEMSQASRVPAASPSQSGVTTIKSRVLVVDDFDDARELYCLALETAGFRAFEAESGILALERAAESPPDAIVLDISMPGMDGWEVVRSLRASERTRDIPVVVLTGSGVRGRVTAGEPGCAAYLMKPCTPQQLIEVVTSVIAGRNANDADSPRLSADGSGR